jgi:cellulose synthase/poly-beta-1,6-N-acetylglucosamine synthase-like glycosyltransferase
MFSVRSDEGDAAPGLPAGFGPPLPADDDVVADAMRRAARLDHAVNRLRRLDATLSAASPWARWQKWAATLLAATLVLVATWSRTWALDVAMMVLSAPFFLVMLVRLSAFSEVIRPHAAIAAADPRVPDHALPPYSVLIALYREVEAVPALLDALGNLDYPRDKLDILLITETGDDETRDALVHHGLEPNMRIITVPAGEPRTKPRALNYALALAHGDLVTVFDAEDIPDRLQLRLAAAAFASADPELAGVQAALNIYNPGTNTITRQFTLEYSTLFDFILPALERLGLPIPLGGTSNHFRRAALEQAGAWDPFNVTEDADLGFRMARQGLKIALIGSTTWEEAPATAPAWMGQRTRWLKGWLQTYLVHMRQPRRLWQELGSRRFLGFQILMGGMLLSALAHPLCLIALISFAMTGTAGRAEHPSLLAILCWANLALCYVSAIVLSVIAVRRRGHRGVARHALLLPVYWLAISFAAYNAVFDLLRRPFYWAKTRHHGFDAVCPAGDAAQMTGVPPAPQTGVAPSLQEAAVDPGLTSAEPV